MTRGQVIMTSSVLAALLVACLCHLGSATSAVSPDDDRLLSRVRRIIGDAEEVQLATKQEMFPFSVTLTGSYSTVEPRKFGFVTLRVRVKKQIHCGASILGKNHVITAAHCLYDVEGRMIATDSWRVYMHGVNRKPSMFDRMKTWVARNAAKITGTKLARNLAHHAHFRKAFVHPNYDKDSIVHDVAIVKTSDIRYDEIEHASPIDLPPADVVEASGPTPGQMCYYSGWGCTRPEGGVREKLLMAGFTVRPLTVCTNTYSRADPVLWRNNLCVQANRTTVCPGDSGGGLRCVHSSGRPYLAGIASSAASGDSPEQYPANFMRISAYVSWIKQTMQL